MKKMDKITVNNKGGNKKLFNVTGNLEQLWLVITFGFLSAVIFGL